MDVQFLHTGEPVLVIEDGEGEPGGYVVGPNRTQVWTENADYRPSKVVRLGAVEEVEPGQIAGPSYDDTATAARAAAIEAGEHPDSDDAQFVHEPEQPEQPAVPGGSPVVGTRTAAEPEADAHEQTALSDAERTELEQLRAAAAERDTATRQDTTTT